MPNKKIAPIMIKAQHISRLDRKGAPLTKLFTDNAWATIHSTGEWVQLDGPKPAALKSKTLPSAPAQSKAVAVKNIKKPATKTKVASKKTNKK